MATVTSVRLEDEDLTDIRAVGKDLGMGQSAALKQALRKGVRELRIENALGKYSKGGLTLSLAAKKARVSIWELLDEMKARNVFLRTDEENLEANLKEL